MDLRNGGEELLDRGLPSASSFGLLYNWPHVLKARWWTVPTVHLRPSAGYFREPYDFVKKLEEITRPDAGFAVKHLIIQVETVSPKKSNDPDEHYFEQVILEMLELLRRTSTLERVDFVEFGKLKDWSNSGISLPTVKTLMLYAGDYIWGDPITAETISSFVALFPSLTTFLLAGCDLLTTETAKTIGTATQDSLHPSLPSPASFLAGERHLRALLTKLLLTPVVDFRYRATKDSEVELRFSREKSGADSVGFEAEWWWL